MIVEGRKKESLEIQGKAELCLLTTGDVNDSQEPSAGKGGPSAHWNG